MIVIVGTGALATLFGARLGRQTAVTMLGTWQEAVAAINRDGLFVEGEPGTRVRATTDPAERAGASLALVLVKAWQTGRVAQQIQSFLSPEGVALTLQNGLGNYETLAATLGEERVVLGTTTQGATLLGPGQVREGGRGVTHVAEHPRLGPLAALLQAAGFETEAVGADNLQALIWGKLAVNCAVNPLTALLRVPNGELLKRPDALPIMDTAAREVEAVAGAQGIRLPYADAAKRVREVAAATANNRSSMFQDILRGGMTEIDAINGAVAREGARLGVETPMNTTLWRLVKALEARP